MEQNGQSVQNARPQKKWMIILLAAVVILLIVVCVLLISGRGKQQAAGPKLKYAEGVTIVDNADALEKEVNEMFEKASQPGIALNYSNNAVSEDGKTFSCYIANSPNNIYDMYIDIYADDAMTDEVFLSGLMRPGEAFREITLDKALPEGENSVTVAFTQVEEDLQTIHAQVLVEMIFMVKKS